MKKTLIAAALAAMAVSPAYALDPSVPANAPSYIIYAAGGSAQANAVYFAASKLLSSMDYITDGACGTNSGNYRVLLGSSTAALTGVTVGTPVLFYYKFNGGSVPNGVNPQGLGSQLPFPHLVIGASTNTAACTGASLPLPTFSFTGTITFDQAVPDWGVSDEEVGLLNFPDNQPPVSQPLGSPPVLGTPLSNSALANITHNGIYENLFGVAVTNNLFSASGHPKTSFTKQEV
ncbi:MAG TPA: hypothetical protein VNX47_14410, partial [Nevskia sp.]|nr:hypothetical protein [Nevskia sp.]